MGNLTTDNLGATKPVSTNQLSTDVERVRGAFETFDAAIHAHQTNTANPHSTTAVQVGAIPDGAGAVNDSRIGSRTADVNSAPTASVGTLTQWVSWTANRIRAITGATNWFDAPATTLAAAKSHMDATGNPHGATAAQVGAIPASNNAVTDAFVGNRTVDQALATPANTGTLTQLLSWMAGRIRAVTGATNWTDAPATTLAAAATHISNTSNPHATTASQVGAPTTSGTGATGTWSINVSGSSASCSGNAATATTASGLNTANLYQVKGLGIGTAGANDELRAVGNVTAYYASDRRLKENVRLIDDPLEKVRLIRGYLFDWAQAEIERRGGEDGVFVRRADIGVLAQDVIQAIPEAVAERPDGYLAVRYELLVPLLIECVHALMEQRDGAQ